MLDRARVKTNHVSKWVCLTMQDVYKNTALHMQEKASCSGGEKKNVQHTALPILQ